MNLLSIVIVRDNVVESVFSFPDTEEGNKKAKEMFLEYAEEFLGEDLSKKERKDTLKMYLEDGRCENGECSISLVYHETEE